MNSEKEVSSTKKRLSCIDCIDALWFCYSPVHQLQQYYRLGELDDCIAKWKALGDCFKLKTKSNAQVEEILEARESEKAKFHIWTFRTVEEASSKWNEQYKDLE